MDITYRRAVASDLDGAVRLVQLAINDLRVRNGLSPTMPLRPAAFQNFCLSQDNSELWVAHTGNELLGFAFSWMIGDFWYLAQLFIRPDAQSKGVGGILMRKANLQEGHARIRNRALITFAYNTASTGLYVRSGLYPRVPLYRMLASASHLRQLAITSDFRVAPMAALPSREEWLGRIDEAALGFRRSAHHEFLLASGSNRAVTIARAGTPVGYAYVSPDGRIGPLAMVPNVDPGDVVRAAIACALEGQLENVSMIVPGPASGVMDVLAQLGFRIDDALVLLSSQPFGMWTNYLPANPAYL